MNTTSITNRRSFCNPKRCRVSGSIAMMPMMIMMVMMLTMAAYMNTSTTYMVHAMPPNPAESYHAIRYLTDDGGQNYTRVVTDVAARLTFESEDDPTEETIEGYTIVYNKLYKNELAVVVPRYEYAIVHESTGDLVASGVPVIKSVPPPEDGRFRKHMRRTAAGRAMVAKPLESDVDSGPIFRHRDRQRALLSHIDDYDVWNAHVEDLHRRRSLIEQGEVQQGPLKLLVIPLQFADHQNIYKRWLPNKQKLMNLMNWDSDIPHASTAPSGSVTKVFQTLSHGKLQIEADVFGWIPLSQPESYYATRHPHC
jgi:hypothetical protein